MKKNKLTIFSFLAIFLCTHCAQKTDQKSVRAEKDSAYVKLTDEQKRLPENALAGIEVADGLAASLFASEPLVGNPTNIDVDAKGRVWMCEALNYRPHLNPDNPQREEGDRILILEDRNGDGKADTSKVFYQGTDVNAAMGVTVLGNKVIVSCSPNVFVFTDENGDDKADKKEVLFSHVGGEQHDHSIHSFTFGPDGKLYFNFGNEGEQLFDKNGKLVIDKDGKAVTNKGEPYRQGMVFRVNMDGSDLEVLAHNFRNNYEVAVDSYGTLWQSDNDDDGNQSTRINYVMEFGNYGYTDEKTGAGWRATRTNMEPEIPKRHWHQNDPGSVPNLLVNGAGSPSGIILYEGNLLPQVFQNQMIHCDAGTNVVRAYPVENDGAGYKASTKPLLEGVRDQWFRPVDVCTAPDGSLFVADWYDPGVGGHQMGDLNRGRIYHIAATGYTAYKVPAINLSTPEGAIEGLQSPNLATRYLAWQQLHQSGAGAEAALQKLWSSSNPRMRARAFWLLGNIKGKEEQYIQAALKDKDPNIRIAGLRLARQIKPDVIPYVKQLVKDTDPQVRREAAIALRHNKSAEAPALWATLAQQYDGNDRWYLEALGIGADEQWDSFFTAWKGNAGNALTTKAGRDIIWRSRTAQALPLLAENITNNTTASADRLRYFRAFDFIEDPSKQDILAKIIEHEGPSKDEIALTALNHFDASSAKKYPKVQAALRSALTSVAGKQQFVDLVRRYKLKDQNETLFKMALAYPDSSLGIESASVLLNSGGTALLKNAINNGDDKTAMAAIKVIGHTGTKESLTMMKSIIQDKEADLAVRKSAVDILGHGWSQSESLLEMIKAGKLPKELEPTAALALQANHRGDIRRKAQEYLGGVNSGNTALPAVAQLEKRTGNIASGKQVFSRTCFTCHQVGKEGSAFGPALTQIGSKLTKEALYKAILQPDEGISFGYEGHVFKLKDGSEVAGIIASETGEAVEISLPGGVKKKYNKTEIASRREMKNSMMPSGLHQAMTEQELVDVVEFLFAQKGDGVKHVANR